LTPNLSWGHSFYHVLIKVSYFFLTRTGASLA
jgi:hypothetical protein